MAIKKLCPNCSGELIMRNGKFECDFCGTSFAVDYDKDDVAMAREATRQDADRARAERAQAYNAAKAEIEQREQTNNAGRNTRSMKKTFLIIGICMTAPYLLYFTLTPLRILASKGLKSSMKNNTLITQSTSETISFKLDKKLIEEDGELLNDAYQSALYLVKDESRNTITLDDVEYEKAGNYELDSIKFFCNDENNYLYFIFRIDYIDKADPDHMTCIYGNAYVNSLREVDGKLVASNAPHSFDVGQDELDYGYYDKEDLIDTIREQRQDYGEFDVDGGKINEDN